MADPDELGRRAERRSGIPDLIDALTGRLTPSELTSVLMAVARARASSSSPAALLRQFEADPLVRPTDGDPRLLLEIDRHAFDAASAFDAVDLGPVAPLGVCSVVSPLSQDGAVAAARNVEVVSDPTNVLALEASLRRRKLLAADSRSPQRVRLCASHRALRPHRIDAAESTQHFRLFALVTAGRDEGDQRFETEAMFEHLDVHLRLLARLRGAGFAIEGCGVELEVDAGSRVGRRLAPPLQERYPDVDVSFVAHRPGAYYPGPAFCVTVAHRGADQRRMDLCDGGLVGWTAALMNNDKERLLISAIGTERVSRVLAPR